MSQHTNPRWIWLLFLLFQIVSMLSTIEFLGRVDFEGPNSPDTIFTIGLTAAAALLLVLLLVLLPRAFNTMNYSTPIWLYLLFSGHVSTSIGFRIVLYTSFSDVPSLLSFLTLGFIPSNIFYGLTFILFTRQNEDKIRVSAKGIFYLLGFYHVIAGTLTSLTIIGVSFVFEPFGLLMLLVAPVLNISLFIALMIQRQILATREDLTNPVSSDSLYPQETKLSSLVND